LLALMVAWLTCLWIWWWKQHWTSDWSCLKPGPCIKFTIQSRACWYMLYTMSLESSTCHLLWHQVGNKLLKHKKHIVKSSAAIIHSTCSKMLASNTGGRQQLKNHMFDTRPSTQVRGCCSLWQILDHFRLLNKGREAKRALRFPQEVLWQIL
jgi:hypothetical protein